MNPNIIRTIKNEIDKGNRQFAIVPFGKLGAEVAKILEENYGIYDYERIDNNQPDCKRIKDIKKETDVVYLLSTIKTDVARELIKEITKIDENAIMVDVLGNNYGENIKKLKLDFLCVGFHKCGTTSLDFAIKKNRYVYTPKEKETYYLKWYNMYENSWELIKQRYPDSIYKEYKVIGGIEPSFYDSSSAAIKCYKDSLNKLVFVLRNPIDATYSMFKMWVRECNDKRAVAMFKKYNKVCDAMFTDWFNSVKSYHEFQYITYINEWKRAFPNAKMQIILFEELVNNTNRVLNEFQRFIGLNEDEIIECDELPRENIGSWVCRDYASAIMMNGINKIINENRSESKNVVDELESIHQALKKKTLVEYHEKLSDKNYKMVYEFFEQSIRQLEHELNITTNWIRGE